ncbi:MAG: ribosome-associated translation inhibitor RaiA [Myxococcota bacterium]|jgi:putative sigma-54 modulation protein|nr:ribosome-associated translation inhibitor RaiA [Myxococcota bacterium]
MNISITFRHMTSSDAIKKHASEKLGKLQKFLRQPMTAKVTCSIDGLKQIAEARISSGGEHLEAKEIGDDMYASIDLVMAKLERQIRRDKGAQESKRRGIEKTAAKVVPLTDGARPVKRTAKAKAKSAKAPAKTAKRAR